MTERPRGRHWSASQFMLFEQCPDAYKSRYVDGVVSEPSLAMLFGSSVHKALEALLQGLGGGCPVTAHAVNMDHARLDCAYDVYERSFTDMRRELVDYGVECSSTLFMAGLKMVDQVNALNLNQDGQSQPEHWFELDADWTYPVVGAVDLWCPPESQHGAVIYDFKTTVGAWSQERAEREKWQPILYAWAYARAYDVVPIFRYLVLNRIDGTVNTFERRWNSRREFRQDLEDLKFHAEEIVEAVLAENFTCTRGHGTCLECGEPYGHQHVCRDANRPAKIRLSRSAYGSSEGGQRSDLASTSA